MDPTNIWIWYIIVLIVSFLIFHFYAKLGISTSIMIAALFALVIGLVMLPYYQAEIKNDKQQRCLRMFVIISSLLPITTLIVVLATGEHKKYLAKPVSQPAAQPAPQPMAPKDPNIVTYKSLPPINEPTLVDEVCLTGEVKCEKFEIVDVKALSMTKAENPWTEAK